MADNILYISKQFKIQGNPITYKPYGCGHINDTFLITTDTDHYYILQKINTNVFRKPAELMKNFADVTSYLRKIILQEGGNPDRETLTLIPTLDDKNFLELDEHSWRMTIFIGNTVTLQVVKNPMDFYQAGCAFGKFTRQLADYPSHTLYETIQNFHNTPSRYRDFEAAVAENATGKAQQVQDEIAFIRARRDYTSMFTDMLARKELPLRVTHNDTKLNNVLLDAETGTPVAVIDLDTVMPGLSLYDFGDSIRFGTNPAAEDEQDLTKVFCDLNYFEYFAKGYLSQCGRMLTKNEIEMLPYAGKMMTLECGMRFLADHIAGDKYFKIHRENHNLDRCRTQLKLVADMEQKLDDMKEIIQNICKTL